MDEELIEYICTAPCLALVGSGPSAECGVPIWRGLANEILQRLNKLSVAEKLLDQIEAAFGQENYPLMFDRISRLPGGEAFLGQNCAELLKTSEVVGAVYNEIARLPFRAYFTTNFDNFLSKHLEKANVAPIRLKNSREDLAKFDVDTLTGYVVKLHGDFDGNCSLVLTEGQYDRVCFSPEYEYLRRFIQSYLMTRHFLIIGYSVRDPDIQAILKQSTFLYKRATPIYAFIANATQNDAEEWDRKYNIRLISYRATSKDHSQLGVLLATIGEYVGNESLPARQRLGVELKVAQSLYMWHRFQAAPQEKMPLDAFRALLLSIGVQKMSADGFVRLADLQTEFRAVTGIEEPNLTENLERALKAACDDGFLKKDQALERYKIDRETIQLVERFRDQYNLLVSTFIDQTKLDFRAQYSHLKEPDLGEIANSVIETINGVFSERGIEIVNMVFTGKQPRLVGAAALFRMIMTSARRLQKPSIQYGFVRYITTLLSSPTQNQERYLEYLSKAFVCMQTLSMDPDGSRFRREFLSNRTLIVDANVLIPLLAVGGSKFEFFDSLLKTAVERGLRLVTTNRLVDEVYDHLTWARMVVESNRGDMTEILRAALGTGRYRKNAFLDGWVRSASTSIDTPFARYVSDIFGDRQEPRFVERKLKEEYGIQILDFRPLVERNQEAWVIRDEIEQFASQTAKDSGKAKSEERIKAEAEVFSYLHFWTDMAPPGLSSADWKCSFLSQGGFLNRIAVEGPYPIGRAVVVSPEGLFELLVRLGRAPAKYSSFAGVLHSSYLYSADYFIDKKQYARFFGGLINEAERIYAEGLDAYREHIDESLGVEFLEDIEPLERPLVVERLETGLAATLEALKQKALQLERENKELTQQLRTEKGKIERLTGKPERMKKYGEMVARRGKGKPRH